jgi:hypothetical protein
VRLAWFIALLTVILATGCKSAGEPTPEGARPPSPADTMTATSAIAPAPTVSHAMTAAAKIATPAAGASAAPEPATPLASYPWPHTESADRLDQRFPKPPRGFTRVPAAPGTFGAFLRTLPLLPDGALVVDFRGTPLYQGGKHPNIAAVVDIDVGTQDLQQCADSVLRMHAEWNFASKRRELAYKAASGTRMTYQSYVQGDRAVADGNKLSLKRQAGPAKDDHGTFRSYLDQVFAWANTASIERDGLRVAFEDLQAGDYFVLPGSPVGHAVLVLDMAKHDDGRVALLLGQGYMPAQSFHVLRETESETWFVVQKGDGQVRTPFWKPFPFTHIRRLP